MPGIMSYQQGWIYWESKEFRPNNTAPLMSQYATLPNGQNLYLPLDLSGLIAQRNPKPLPLFLGEFDLRFGQISSEIGAMCAEAIREVFLRELLSSEEKPSVRPEEIVFAPRFSQQNGSHFGLRIFGEVEGYFPVVGGKLHLIYPN
jgi:hypothetical protein